MSDSETADALPPQGSYTIDWDAIDENTNPFQAGPQRIPRGAPSSRVSPPLERQLSPSFTSPEGLVSATPRSAANIESPMASQASPDQDLSVILPEIVVPDPDDESSFSSQTFVRSQSKLKSKVEIPLQQDGLQSSTQTSNWRESNHMGDSLELSPAAPVDHSTLELVSKLREKEEEWVSLTATRDEMLLCLERYEVELIHIMTGNEVATQEHKDALQRVVMERDQAAEDLDTVHRAFQDLHRRHESTKKLIQKYKENEIILKETLQQHLNHQRLLEQKHQSLRKLAEEKLNTAKIEIDSLRGSFVGEIDRLKSSLKRAEIQVKSLENQLVQKVQENAELTKICDELLVKHM